MHFPTLLPTLLAVLLTLAPPTAANNPTICVSFYATVNIDTNRGDMYMEDDGVIRCHTERLLGSEPNWLRCQAGYHAWVSKDMKTVAFAHHNRNYRLTTDSPYYYKRTEKWFANGNMCDCYGYACYGGTPPDKRGVNTTAVGTLPDKRGVNTTVVAVEFEA